MEWFWYTIIFIAIYLICCAVADFAFKLKGQEIKREQEGGIDLISICIAGCLTLILFVLMTQT